MLVLVLLMLVIIAVMIHEAGHYFTARRYGVIAPVFSIGFGPLVFKRTFGSGEGKTTELQLRALPLGGYVSIPHEEVKLEWLDHAAQSRWFWLAKILCLPFLLFTRALLGDEPKKKENESPRKTLEEAGPVAEFLSVMAGPLVNFTAGVSGMWAFGMMRGLGPIESLIRTFGIIHHGLASFFGGLIALLTGALHLPPMTGNIEGVLQISSNLRSLQASAGLSFLELVVIAWAGLNLLLVLMNLLPFPALDGCHAVFACLKMLFPHKVCQVVQVFSGAVGFAVICSLTFWLLFKDLVFVAMKLKGLGA